jgi:hypothetical protein
MALIDLQRAAVAACLGPEPSAEQLAPLGDARIWRIYRDAIRKRLRGELNVAFPRTRAAAGEQAFGHAFEHFLTSEPPRVRYFHAVAGSFAESAVLFFASQSEVPAHVPDLCAYEATLWTVADLPDQAPPGLSEFAFEARPVLAPALRLLALRYPVHVEPASESWGEPGEHHLCVHRRPEERQARTIRLNAVGYDLLQRFAGGEQTVAEAIQQVAGQRSLHVDERFLDGLCAMLADLIDRGVIVGARS